MRKKDQPLKVEVVDGRLEISVGIDTLVFCEEQRALYYEGKRDGRITNNKGFCEDVARALCKEEEDGTTPMHTLLDKAIQSAKDDGSEWVEYE